MRADLPVVQQPIDQKPIDQQPAASSRRSALRDLAALLSAVPRRPLLALGAATLAASLTEGLGLLMLVPLIEALQTGRPMPGSWPHWAMTGQEGALAILWPWLLAFLLVAGLRALAMWLRDVRSVQVQSLVVDQLRERALRALLQAEWRALGQARMAEQNAMLVTDIGRVGQGLHAALQGLVALSALAVALASACWLSWQASLLVLSLGGLSLWWQRHQRREAVLLGQRMTDANHAIQASLQDALGAMKQAKVLGREDLVASQVAQAVSQLRQHQWRFVALSAASRATQQWGSAAVVVLCLVVGLAWLAVPLSHLLTLVVVFGRVAPVALQAQQQHQMWLHAWPALENVWQQEARWLAQAEPAEPAEPVELDEKAVSPLPPGELRLAAVGLRHGPDAPWLFRDLSLALPAGQVTLLEGASGSGKTSLADLAMGLITPDEGEVFLGEQPLRDGLRRAWRRKVAYVTQDVRPLTGTVRQNLLGGLSLAAGLAQPEWPPDPLLWAALQRAGAGFVAAWPQGLDTPLGDGGRPVSGGEAQRLVLARALVGQPRLLILDEATSALDEAREADIIDTVAALGPDVAVLVISHRTAWRRVAHHAWCLLNGHLSSSVNSHTSQGDLVHE